MANGLFAGGNGTVESPYLIEDAHDLNAIRNNLTAHYKLINDIDLDVEPYNTGTGWVPIGNINIDGSTSFKGILDGNFYTIKSLYINNPTASYVGIFKQLWGSTIKNLELKNVYMCALEYFGAIAGRGYTGANIINCCVTGDSNFVSMTANVGGPLGSFVGNINGDIKNCYSTANLIGNKGYIGGITCGIYSGNTSLIHLRIENCYFSGTIESISSSKGGIIASPTSVSATNCFYDKDILGTTPSNANGTGLTTSQMQNPQTFIDAGWDASIWMFRNGNYPKLFYQRDIKFLLQGQNSLFTIEDENLVNLLTLEQSEELFETRGFNDISSVNSIEIESNMKLLMWTDDLSKSSATLEYDISPTSILDNPTDYKLLMYTDDETITGAKLNYDCDPYRPIDKLSNPFGVLAYREQY